MRDRVRVYCDSQTNSTRPIPKAKEKLAEIQRHGLHRGQDRHRRAATIPARFDRVNWTANNAEIDHMVDKVAFVRESLPKQRRPRGRHARALRRDHGQAGGQGSWSRSSCCCSKSRCRPRTSTPCATSASPPRRRSAAARTCSCGTASARCWRSGRRTSSCPTSRSAAGCSKRARSPTWRTPTTCRWRRTAWSSPIGTMASCHVCAAIPNFLVLEWHWIPRLHAVEGLRQGRRDHREGLRHRAGPPGHRRRDERGGGAQGADQPGSQWFEPAA